MSEHKVLLTKVEEILPHTNADRLEISRILGWYVVIQKNTLKVGDPVIYIPIDSILPESLETLLFPPDSKITLDKHRVKSIKIRGALSQGMIVPLKELAKEYPKLSTKKIGDDVLGILGITKYEPPPPPSIMQGRQTSKRKSNSYFSEYTNINKVQFYPNTLQENEEVYITEKLHGSQVRLGYLPQKPNTFIKKIKKFFHLLGEFEWVYGSHHVQLQDRCKSHKGYYSENIYYIIGEQFNLRAKLEPNMVLYGEIVGKGIQKGYTYGCNDSYDFYAFDISIDGNYLDPEDFKKYCDRYDIKRVPVLYEGPYTLNKAWELATGPSVIMDRDKPSQSIREGCVVKPVKNRVDPMAGRVVFKFINPDYLLMKENTDFH